MNLAATLFALLASAAMPAYTTYKYLAYAHAPAEFDDAHAEALVTLFIAQLPLCILAAVFAAVSHLDGPMWRRVLVFVITVAIIAAIGGFWRLASDSQMGPILGWAIVMQLMIIAVAGPQPALARARIDAVAYDSANLFILAVFAMLIGCAVSLALLVNTRGPDGVSRIEYQWSDLAWIVGGYFACRAWSAIYVFTPAFEARGKGYFQRAWIDRAMVHILGKPRQYGDG
jgi:hypothetical protein